RLSDLGDAVPSHERSRAEMLVNDAREAVRNEAGVDRTRPLVSELQQVYAGLASHETSGAGPGAGTAGGAAGGPAAGGTQDTGAGGGGGDEDVIDADFDKG
ncbi:molecular chaperone DnaK, partial [Streptomyces violaceusniger]